MAPPASPAGVATAPAHRWWVHKSAWVAGGALLAVAAVAWIGVVAEARAMPDGMAPGFGGRAAAQYLGSWGIMMAAMMLPSAAGMIALYGTVGPAMAARRGEAAVPIVVFALPYALVWLLTGVPAYLGSVTVSTMVEANPAMAELVPYLVALVLAGAGAYQLSPLKRVCLRQCRGPLAFLAQRWRPGARGALRLGFSHAGYCLGCCWALMVVLVAAGAMQLAWVVLIAVLVFAEKVLPYGGWTARLSGAALIAAGLAVAASGSGPLETLT